MMIQVMLLGRNQLIREALIAILANQADIHIEQSHSLHTINKLPIDNYHPNIIILIADPISLSWQTIIKKTQQKLPASRLLFLAEQADNIYPPRLIQAGASGYLTQHDSPEIIIKAIHSLANHQPFISLSVANQLTFTWIKTKRYQQPFHRLSNRELTIAHHLAKGYTIKEIAKKLSLRNSTINCFQFHILQKLHCKNTIELTYLAAQHRLIDASIIKMYHSTSLAQSNRPSYSHQPCQEAL